MPGVDVLPVKCRPNATNYLVLVDFTHSAQFFSWLAGLKIIAVRSLPDKGGWNELNDLIVGYPHTRSYQMTDMNNS